MRKVAFVIEPVTQPTARVTDAEPSEADRYLSFERDTWAQLRASTPLTLGARELSQLQGINDQIDLDEVATIYLPLSRLLNLYVTTIQDLYKVSSTFLPTGRLLIVGCMIRPSGSIMNKPRRATPSASSRTL